MQKAVINADLGKHTINRNVYGHFAEHLGRCIYEGVWVGEESPIPNTRGIRNDVVAALRKLQAPVIRWPGGCFADTYHWRDGIGPREDRPAIVNVHWGGVSENNHFGTHEFLDFCEQVGCEPYICGNLGSGTVREMAEWVEYITGDPDGSPQGRIRAANGRREPWKLTYWGVGNENWGCGGSMRPEYYADEYRRYQTYLRNFSGGSIFKIACGCCGDDPNWTDVVMRQAGHHMNGFAPHYYTGPGPENSATEYGEKTFALTLKNALFMDRLITNHSAIMDRHDPDRRVAMIVDEWGAWYAVEPGTNPGFLYQQSTVRDALVASVTLDIFAKHCRRVQMANIAQTINVLQAMILTDKEKMLLTPTYHVFEMYKVHHDALMLPVDLEAGSYTCEDIEIPALSACASLKDGKVHLSLSNLDPNAPKEVACELRGVTLSGKVSGRVLASGAVQDHNTFDKPDLVKPAGFDGATLEGSILKVKMPPASVAVLEIA